LFAKRSTDQLMDAFERAGGTGSRCRANVRDPQAIARAMTAEVNHTRLGPVRTLGSPIKIFRYSPNLRLGAPLLGQHTAEIMNELGYGDSDIDRLSKDGAVIVAGQ